MTPLQHISKDLVHNAEDLLIDAQWLGTYAKALHLKSLEHDWVTEEEEGIRTSVETYLRDIERMVRSLNTHFNEYLDLIKEQTEEEQ